MSERTEQAVGERAAAGGLRAWRPGAERLREDDGVFRPVGYGGYRSAHHRDAAPRRPLTAALVMVARDGIGTVGRVLRVQDYGAIAALAFRLRVPKRVVRRWGLVGVERDSRCSFAEAVEDVESHSRGGAV